jgi:hypothetical protein
VTVDGKSVPARRITLQPFVDDPRFAGEKPLGEQP